MVLDAVLYKDSSKSKYLVDYIRPGRNLFSRILDSGKRKMNPSRRKQQNPFTDKLRMKRLTVSIS